MIPDEQVGFIRHPISQDPIFFVHLMFESRLFQLPYVDLQHPLTRFKRQAFAFRSLPSVYNTPLRDEAFNDQACALCGKVVSTKHGMARHLKIVHEGISELVLPCACCGKKFSAKHGLERHMRLIHETSKVFACHECLKCFPDTESRRSHEQNDHGGK
ncbi:unnamed protein product [Schistosoma mattheei]|uniref:Uncharacterized protein n=1 Tax=Schistosoma mattheei TaxID=31246 RepID=A0A183PW42_9TREM|nr:unnamed protein product [Schistosoma mattheei]